MNAYIAAVFESEGPTLASRSSPSTRPNRKETPPDLLEQIPYVRRVLEADEDSVLEYPGF